MSNPDILFRGIPRTPTRSYTAELIRAMKPKQVAIPCTGSFSLAWVAREGGVPADRIFAGDISLYSTALGHAIMDQDWRLVLRETEVSPYIEQAKDLVRGWMDSPIRKAAAVMYTIRILQYQGKKMSQHKQDMQRELIFNSEAYLQYLRDEVEKLVEMLGGMTYRAQDMWLTLDQYREVEDCVMLVNPPRYTGGYDRMFAGVGDVFEWDEPEASQFTEKDYGRLMDMLEHDPSTTLLYYATQGDDPAELWGAGWRSVFADMPASKKVAAINWIIANRDPIGVQVTRAKIGEGAAKFRLFNGEIAKDSQIAAVRVDKLTGDYYRDLFIHKLPGALTEVYVALLIDGCLLGIVGLHLADLRRGKVVTKGERVLDHCASVTFAFTVPNVHKRLHKLTLGSIISSWFWDDVLGSENWYAINGCPRNVKTVMLTQHPENKTARGIMALDERDPQKDGTYKLHYSAPVIHRDRPGTFQWWFGKWGTGK